MTYKLLDGSYAAITEGALYNYSGMTLYRQGKRIFKATFLDGQSWGFKEPFGGAWKINGDVISPWRITMATKDLNELVNCDIVYNVNPKPDSNINWSFVKPGRSVWSWWAFRHLCSWSFLIESRYIKYAFKLDFEYILLDSGWSKIPKLFFNGLLDKAKNNNIGVWIWKSWWTLNNNKSRHKFYSWCKEKEIKGVKIDYMADESKDMIDFYEANLITAAEYGIMLNFHGANKATGYSRRFPNEMTHEGVRGLEYKRYFFTSFFNQRGHDSALVFTRLLGGHADYTPVTFNPFRMGKTSLAHQLANALMFISPVTHWADNPKRYLNKDERIVNIIRTIPTTWDETMVFPGSEIMDAAAIARRKGDAWFIGIVNDENPRTFDLNLSFLDVDTIYNAVLVKDKKFTKAGWNIIDVSLQKNDNISIYLRREGGFVAKISPRN